MEGCVMHLREGYLDLDKVYLLFKNMLSRHSALFPVGVHWKTDGDVYPTLILYAYHGVCSHHQVD
jgi:hypothetical protein